jgi:hypothetical protein
MDQDHCLSPAPQPQEPLLHGQPALSLILDAGPEQGRLIVEDDHLAFADCVLDQLLALRCGQVWQTQLIEVRREHPEIWVGFVSRHGLESLLQLRRSQLSVHQKHAPRLWRLPIEELAACGDCVAERVREASLADAAPGVDHDRVARPD